MGGELEQRMWFEVLTPEQKNGSTPYTTMDEPVALPTGQIAGWKQI